MKTRRMPGAFSSYCGMGQDLVAINAIATSTQAEKLNDPQITQVTQISESLPTT